jgi:hypothetical protein
MYIHVTVYIHNMLVSFNPQHFRYIWPLTEFNPLKPSIRLNCVQNVSSYIKMQCKEVKTQQVDL